jgi:hypothetical protein
MEQKKPKILFLNKEQIVQHKRTYKEYDALTFHKLVSSIALYGQIMPIVVTQKGEKFHIISGGKIYEAMQQIGYAEYFCVEITDTLDVADVLLNELIFKTNYIELSEKLLSKNIDELKRFLPYNDEEVEKIKTIASFDWNKIISKSDDSQISLFDETENQEDTTKIDNFKNEKSEEIICEKNAENTEQFEVKNTEQVKIENRARPIKITSFDASTNEESKIKQVIEEEKETVSLDIQAFGTNWEDESLRQQYPANVEGSDEFNQTNLIGNKLVEVVEIITEQSQIVNPHIVYKDTSGSLKTMSEEKALLVKEEMGIEIVPLHRATYSDCQIFINQQKE